MPMSYKYATYEQLASQFTVMWILSQSILFALELFAFPENIDYSICDPAI